MKFKAKGSFVAVFITFGVVAITFGVGFLTIFLLRSQSIKTEVVATSTSPFSPIVLDSSNIIGKAAIIYDPTDNQVLFQKNAGEPLPLASVTKLGTAETVLSEHPSNPLITITSQDLLHSDAGDFGLRAGDTLSLDKLMQLGFVASSNDAMAAVANSLGPDAIEKINNKVSSLGLQEFVFYDPTGLDVSTTTSGAYGSAHDVAVLAADFYSQFPTYFELTEEPSITINDNGRSITDVATDAPLLSIPGLVGAKTGYTNLAGGNLVAVFDVEIGHPLVAVVLGSTERGRFQDIRALINAARHSLSL